MRRIDMTRVHYQFAVNQTCIVKRVGSSSDPNEISSCHRMEERERKKKALLSWMQLLLRESSRLYWKYTRSSEVTCKPQTFLLKTTVNEFSYHLDLPHPRDRRSEALPTHQIPSFQLDAHRTPLTCPSLLQNVLSNPASSQFFRIIQTLFVFQHWHMLCSHFNIDFGSLCTAPERKFRFPSNGQSWLGLRSALDFLLLQFLHEYFTTRSMNVISPIVIRDLFFFLYHANPTDINAS
jgi:hypothetical protein